MMSRKSWLNSFRLAASNMSERFFGCGKRWSVETPSLFWFRAKWVSTIALRAMFISALILLPLFTCSPVWAAYGISMGSELKYGPEFKQFEYTSSRSLKGGRVTLHDIGSFDKLNPFTLKGQSPFGMEWLLYDPLAVESLDEPFSLYGLIAQDIQVASDNLSVTFTLNKKARFSDGTSITAKDVIYTLHLLQGPLVHPYYNYYYRDITGADILGPRTVRFSFRVPNRELPLIASQIRVLPAHDAEANIADTWERLPVGSGPYTVTRVDPGKTIVYSRTPKYWAIDHPTRKNMFNFDEIEVKYFKDQTVALEAFKAGEFDFISINIAKQWARDMTGKNFKNGSLVKKSFPHSNGAGIQGFVMNTRRSFFQDVRVRKAMGLALDFRWINQALFHNQYTRSNSYFSNSVLAAKGIPRGLELQYLEPYRKELPPEVFTQPPMAPVSNDRMGMRKNLLEARELLRDAGWNVRNGVLRNAKGQPFRFEIILGSRAFERVMASYVKNLRKLGAEVSYRTIDPALYMEKLRSFDFDMTIGAYGQSQSPGNEQRNFWHSTAAKRKGSRNYAGVQSPVVDALVDRIVYSRNRSELEAACHALDRVLWYGYYLVPNWYLPYHRIGYRSIFGMPHRLPLYYSPDQLLMTWWLVTH